MPASTASRVFLLLLLAAITATFLAMIKAFLMAVLMAGIFASLTQPIYRRILGWTRDRRSFASILTLVFIVLVVILPLGAFLGVVTSQAIRVGETIANQVPQDVQNLEQFQAWFSGLPVVGRIQGYLQGLPFPDQTAPDQQAILGKAAQFVQWLSGFLINSLSAATTGTLQFLFMLGVMLYSMYFFLIDGGRLIDRILFYLPLEDAEERRLLGKFRSVTRATLKGTAVIGILQGGLAGLAFAVVGIPSSVFWGTAMVVLSIIPGIGTGLVWAPAAIVLMAGGHWAQGIGLAVFCGLVVGSIDNVLRPRLVGKDTQMPDLLILLATLGGILMFGILGFIIGPIVAALFLTVWEIYGSVFEDVLPKAGPALTTPSPARPEGPDDQAENHTASPS